MSQHKTAFKAILFDLDGTLVDSLQDIADSMNRVLTKKGLPTHPIDSYRYFVGNGLNVLVSRSLPQVLRTEAFTRSLFLDLLEDYEQNCLKKTGLYDGIPDLLDKLMDKSLKMAILSNKADEFTKTIAASLLSHWPFSVVVGAREGIPRKPDPTAALQISQILQIPPAEFMYVGDTSVDMKTALAAGMYPVGVSWGFRKREELMEHGAKVVIDKPGELLDLI